MLSQSTLFGLAAATLASMAAIIHYSHDTLTISLGFATIAGAVSYYMLPQLIPVFILSNIVGKDVLKRDRPVLYVSREQNFYDLFYSTLSSFF